MTSVHLELFCCTSVFHKEFMASLPLSLREDLFFLTIGPCIHKGSLTLKESLYYSNEKAELWHANTKKKMLKQFLSKFHFSKMVLNVKIRSKTGLKFKGRGSNEGQKKWHIVAYFGWKIGILTLSKPGNADFFFQKRFARTLWGWAQIGECDKTLGDD